MRPKLESLPSKYQTQQQTATRLGSGLGLAVLLAVVLPGCAYRFTNQHIDRPANIRTVAVEAIYDTTREVVPHEILWENLQKAIAEDGHLQLAHRGTADALLRAHLRKASTSPTGTVTKTNEKKKDPEVFNRQDPPELGEIPRMALAREYRNQALLSYEVAVELVHLRTRDVLFRKTYSLATVYRTFSSRRSNDFLRAEEALQADFASTSLGMSRQMIKDILVR